MIRINLLPEEYRRKAKTPIKLMLAVTCMVAINASLAAWWGWVAYGVAAEIESERGVLTTEKEGLDPQVAYHKSLDGERKQHKLREDTLAQITTQRINWTRKLDELIDVVNRGGDGQRHLIWLDDLHVSRARGVRGKQEQVDFGTLKASGHSGSDKFAQVANFLEDLEGSPFVADFRPPAPPEGSEAINDEELVPSTVWAFPLKLDLKGPEERQ